MTLNEFNAKGLKAGQNIKVHMNDGTTKTVQLAQGYAYPGHDAQESYLGGPGRKATPPSIVIINHEKPQGDGIELESISHIEIVG
jgi:hypothetical protein